MNEENKTFNDFSDIIREEINKNMTSAFYRGMIVGAHTGMKMAWGKIRNCTSAKEIKRILKAEADKADKALRGDKADENK